MILGILLILASLVLLGCTAIDDATSDLENKAGTQIQNQSNNTETDTDEKPELECEDKYWFDGTTTECGHKEFCGMYMYQDLQTFDSLETCADELGKTAEDGCEYKYWFDSTSTSCGFKQFCGMFMYQDLRTFETLIECTNTLNNVDVVSVECLDMDEEEKWDCLVDLAETNEDMAICNQITLKDKRNTCIKTVSHILHDLDECDKLTDKDDKLICKVYSGAQSTGGMT